MGQIKNIKLHIVTDIKKSKLNMPRRNTKKYEKLRKKRYKQRKKEAGQNSLLINNMMEALLDEVVNASNLQETQNNTLPLTYLLKNLAGKKTKRLRKMCLEKCEQVKQRDNAE